MDFIALFADVASETLSALQNATEGWTDGTDDGGGGGGFGMGMGNDTGWGGVGNDTGIGLGGGNGTIISPVEGGDVVMDEGNYVLNTILGLLIVLVASVLNALGLNLTKLDHIRQQSIPRRERRREVFRVLWLAGMGTYIASQVFGSPLALKYLRPDWVAPLGASSLIFNFIFAYWLVGTPVTSTDINGTATIILGVILILIFSSINHGLSQSLPISLLNELWSRGSWLAWFTFLILFNGLTYLTSHLLARLLASRASYSPLPSPSINITPRSSGSNPFSRCWNGGKRRWEGMERMLLGRMERMLQRADDARLTWLQGIGWGVCGGGLAGMCLVFTKVVVKIFWLPGHPLVHPSAAISLVLVLLTAILQIVCLNRALACADTVVVVPLFYAGYTVFGFINALIFFDQSKQYARWALIATFLSIGVLITGVVLLSLKSSEKAAPDPYTVTSESNSIHLRPRQPRGRSSAGGAGGADGYGEYESAEDGRGKGKGYDEERGGGGEEVMWEVGSLSDSDDENYQNGKKPLAAGQGSRGSDGIAEDGRADGESAGGGEDGEGGEEERRRGASQPGGRGERRGLLGDDEDEGDEGDEVEEGGLGADEIDGRVRGSERI